MATIRIETQKPLGWLTINRPAQRNALTTDMWSAIPEAIAALDEDESVRVILIRGAGEDAFAAGADIAELQRMGGDARMLADFEEKFEAAQASIEQASKPVIAAIRGSCMGGGLALALACDMRIAGVHASFAIPAARLGLGYAAPAVARLMRVVGPVRAFEILATARTYDAGAALKMGLISDAIPEWHVFDHAEQVAKHMAINAPLTLRAAKSTVLALSRADSSLAEAEKLILQCGASADFAEGRQAFMEKRSPKFEGV